MKAKMKIKYCKAWLFIVGVVLLLALFLVMAIIYVFESHNYGLAILCALLGIVLVVAIYFRFNYGITINKKRVVVIEQAGIKVLRYNDVASIVIKFTNESVVAYIKMKKQQEHVFVWEDILLGTNVFLQLKNKIKLDNKFIKNSIDNLSQCPKVKIQNFYIAR